MQLGIQFQAKSAWNRLHKSMVLGYNILHPSKLIPIDDKIMSTTSDNGHLSVTSSGSFIGIF